MKTFAVLLLFAIASFLFPAPSYSQWKQVTGIFGNFTAQCLAAQNSGIFVGTYDGIIVSRDSGTTWSQLTGGFPQYTPVYSLLAFGGQIFAGTDGIYASTDDGASWHASGTGFLDYCTAFVTNGGDIFRSVDLQRRVSVVGYRGDVERG